MWIELVHGCEGTDLDNIMRKSEGGLHGRGAAGHSDGRSQLGNASDCEVLAAAQSWTERNFEITCFPRVQLTEAATWLYFHFFWQFWKPCHIDKYVTPQYTDFVPCTSPNVAR